MSDSSVLAEWALGDPSRERESITAGLQQVQQRLSSGAPPVGLWPEPARLGEGPAGRLLARLLR